MSAIQFENDFDLNGHSLLNTAIEMSPKVPGGLSTNGRMYFNTSTSTLDIKTKTDWVSFSVGGDFTETDPIFTASVAAGITAGNISTWNGKAESADIPTNNNVLINGAGYITGTTGFTGSFATATDTITVTNGLITAVAPI